MTFNDIHRFKLHRYYTLQGGIESSVEKQVEEAIKIYGNAPRDVYTAIIDPTQAEQGIETALKEITLDDLVRVVHQLAVASPRWSEHYFPHKLLAIDVKANADAHSQHDEFIPRFRSEHIGKKVIEHVGFLQIQQARGLFRVYQCLPQSSTLAGWIFEGLVHRILSGADSSAEKKLVPMEYVPKKAKGLYYSLSSEPSAPFPLPDREFTAVEFPGGNFNWPPHSNSNALENCLCIPKFSNNPLFDSFFVDFENTEISVTPVVWIFQITTSAIHQGSKRGYPIIDRIVDAATERAKELVEYRNKNSHPQAPKAPAITNIKVDKVKVKYVVVHPSPVQDCSWTMPEVKREGDVFCLFVDVQASASPEPDHELPGMSR